MKNPNYLGPDALIETNDQGGKQSALPLRFDLIDPKAIMALAEVLAHGAKKYDPWNWLKIPSTDHLNHALVHCYAHLDGDTQNDHLEHAFCRMMMALAMKYRESAK